MQTLNIYAIYDVKTKAYMNPWYQPTDPAAIRMFADCARDKDHAIGAHPEDYHLVKVGIWKPEKGLIVAMETPQTLTTAVACLPLEEITNA